MPEIILIVDDDVEQLQGKIEALEQKLHYRTLAVKSDEAVDRAFLSRRPKPDLMLLDIDTLGANGLSILRAVKRVNPEFPVIALLRYGDHDNAVKAANLGAHNCLFKPVLLEQLKLSLQHALQMRRMSHYISWLERKVAGHVDFSDIIGQSAGLVKAVGAAREAAVSPQPVWIEGESGTGKELLARAVHGASDRMGKPFVVVNCQTLPERLTSIILFGQEKSASNGARHFVLGKLREADQGTLLLKEVDTLAPEIQQQLLAAIETQTLTPAGADAPLGINIRIMCTTSRTPEYYSGAVNAKLLAKLKRNTIELPPLVQRKSDIPHLAAHFLTLHAASENKYIREISDAGLHWLNQYQWPGNIGQLAHVIWRAVMLCDRPHLDVNDLQVAHRSKPLFIGEFSGSLPPAEGVLLDERGQVKSLKSVEEEAIRFALKHTNGCMTRAAKSLGIGRSTLYRKVNELSIDGYISRANQTTRPMMNVSSTDRS